MQSFTSLSELISGLRNSKNFGLVDLEIACLMRKLLNLRFLRVGSGRLSQESSRLARRKRRLLLRFYDLQVQLLEPRQVMSVSISTARPYWGNGHYYVFTKEDNDWTDAYDRSRSAYLSQLETYGYLATITSSGENSFIYNYSYDGKKVPKDGYIAGTDSENRDSTEGNWLWRTGPDRPENGVIIRSGGKDKAYTNWYTGEPNNDGNQDFLKFGSNGYWYDRDSDQDDDGYITEWGRSGSQFTATFSELGSSGTVNGRENGQVAKMTINFDRKVPSDYVDIRNDTPLIDIPITFGGNAVSGTDYEISVSGGNSYFKDGRVYVRNTQTVTLSFTPKNNNTWQAARSITASLGADGSENIYSVGTNATSQVWLFDDEPLLSLGQGAYKFIRAPYTAGSSQSLPVSNSDFSTSADTMIFDTDSINETESSFKDQGFYDRFAMRWESYLRIPQSGNYIFRTASDDGHKLSVRRNNNSGASLAAISQWSDGAKSGSTNSISLQQGDVVWFQFDYYDSTGSASAQLTWDRPNGSGGVVTNEVIPASAMFLSESLARGVDRTEGTDKDSTSLGFQLFANKEATSALNVLLTSTSETSNSTVNTSLAQRRTGSTQVGDDYAIISGGSQITTSTIGLNGSYGTLSWQPNKSAGSMQNIQSFDVQVLTDSYAESTESITLTLGANSGYGVSNTSQTVSIADSSIVLSVKSGQNPQEGGNDNADLGWFVVSTNGRVAPSGGLILRYSVSSDSSVRNADYTAPRATLSTTTYKAEDLVVMPAGATETKIYIAALADAIREGDEKLSLTLQSNIETDDKGFRFQRYYVDSTSSQAGLILRDSTAYKASVVTTPPDRTGKSTVRAQLINGRQEASFDVRLTSQPRAGVTLSLSSTSGTLSKQQLTFSADNWTLPQRVTVNGQRTDQATTVTVTSNSSDSFYHGLSTQQRIVPSSWPTELVMNLWEGGAELPAQPAASVIPNDGNEGPGGRFGFEIGLGAPVVDSAVELLYSLSGGNGFTLEGSSADIRHQPDATYRPLELKNTSGSSGGPGYASMGNLTTVSSQGEFSVQAWVRLDRDTDSTSGGVLDFSNSGKDGITLGFRNNKPSLEIRDSSGVVLTQIIGGSVVALSEWNHLACSIDSNNVATLYLNGELAGRKQLAQKLPSSARAENNIGKSFVNGTDYYLNAAVRGVAVWNAARSQDQIQASMIAESASGSGLISCLPLNNSTINTVTNAPAASLKTGSNNTAGFATSPIFGLFLPVGAYRVSVPMATIDDLTAEGTELLSLSLVDSGRYSIGGSSSTGTAELSDNDTADVQFLAAWSNLDDTSTGWTSTSQFRLSESDQRQNNITRLGIKLSSRPVADVRLIPDLNAGINSDVRLTSLSGTSGSAIELVFTPDNWDQVQEIQLQGLDDSVIDGDISRQLSFKVSTTDTAYTKLAPGVSLMILDDDTFTASQNLESGQNAFAPMAEISAPSQSRILESGSDSAQFSINLSSPAAQDTLVFFNLNQSNRQLFAGDISVTASQNAQTLTGLARFDACGGSTETVRVDSDGINETKSSFNSNGQTGDFTSTWSGYIIIPETGSYTFNVPVQGGIKLSLGEKTLINQMIDTQATWSTDTIQLNRGDFVAFRLDYRSFNTANPLVSLNWQRPKNNGADIVKEQVPAEAFSRVDGFHLLISKGSSNATVIVRGLDDAIQEGDETLSVSLLNARGVELVMTGQSVSTDGTSQLDIRLGTTDRESVTLVAGTVLPLGKKQGADGQKSDTVAQFTLGEAVTIHRDRTSRISGRLTWSSEATLSAYSGSVVDLVSSTDNGLYQVPDSNVTLMLSSQLIADSASGQGRYLASLKLKTTNRTSVTFGAGTEIRYRNESTNEFMTLVLVDNLTIHSEETINSVAVQTKDVSTGLDLSSATSSLIGIESVVELPNNARLTITDNDTAGIQFSTNADGSQTTGDARQALTEQGSSLSRYVRLKSQPNNSVTVYLESNDTSEALLQISSNNSDEPTSRIALTFTPENWNVPQAFQVVPVDDQLVDLDQNVEIYSRTTSADPFYSIKSAGQISFLVKDNDLAGLVIELQQSMITKAGNGFLNFSLSAQPTSDVVVKLEPSDSQFTINNRSVGRTESIIFTPDNWSIVQTVAIFAVDDNSVEDITTSTLQASTSSSDSRFNGLSVEPVQIVISDNDLPTASIQLVSDAAEEGSPGRFRIVLSNPTASSDGSTGLVVNYRITAVEVDSGLTYGSDVAGRLDKIVQTPAAVSGSVRIAPGQSISDILVVPIDDFFADSRNKSISVKLVSGDGYQLSSDSNSTSATVRILNNDIAGMILFTSGERLLVKESGESASFQLALLSQPASVVSVTLREKVPSGASRQMGSATTAYTYTTTFTSDNWYVPQQISVQAFDDFIIEDGTGSNQYTGIHPAELIYSFSSSDKAYDSASHTNETSYFTNTTQKVDVLDYQLSNNTAESMRSSLTTLQEGIDSLALPMIGGLSGKTGQGLRKFITNLTNSIRQVNTPTPKKLSRLLSREIAAALGVSEDAVTVDLSMKDTTSSNPAVVVRFRFADQYNVLSIPLAADFGLPGLGFKTTGSIDATFSYDAGLQLVFPRSGDIYLDTNSDQTYLTANFNAGFSDNFSLKGGLGFLQLDALNQPSVNENVKIGDEPASTELDISFDLNLGGGGGEDHMLTFSELTSSALDLESIFQYQLSGNAAISLAVTTSVGGSAAIPKFKFNLSSLLPLFDYSNQEETEKEDNGTSFYFDNIRLDLGSYISDMLDPIVSGVDDILKPLYPLVDALYSDTKIFGTLGLAKTFDTNKDGKTSTIDLAQWFANFYSKIDSTRGKQLKSNIDQTVNFLDLLKGMMDLVRDLKKLSAEDGFYIDFGSYELEAFTAGNEKSDTADVKVDEDSTKNLKKDTKEQADKGGKNDASGKSNSQFQKIMAELNDLGFTIPLIEDPANTVKLLLGQEVSLFEWRMPGMGMSSDIDETFPIYGGIEGVIEGGFNVAAHIGFGFDTYGLSQWRNDNFAPKDSWKVFNGFYVADLDSKGKDIPEFTMDATMGAGLGFSARVVRADITGGLEAEASFDLLDEGEIAGKSDGKIRGTEITDRISNPLNLFELTGELSAYVKSRVQIGIDMGFYSIWDTVWERRLAEIPIFKFGIGGRYGTGTASNGHLDGATVFFDANFNGHIDSLEPQAITDADGHYSLDVDLRTFDTNRNGKIDANEGQLMVFGGKDTSMDMPLSIPFVAPLGAMITPLTSLYSLAIGAGVPPEEAHAFIRKAFDLGDFDFLTTDPLNELKQATTLNDPAVKDAVSAYMAHFKLHFAWDLVSGALAQLLPADVPNDLNGKMDLLKAFSEVLLEKPSGEAIKDKVAQAIKTIWTKINPDSTPVLAELAAKAEELAASASMEVGNRLDKLRDDALRNGVSPRDLLQAIDSLKKQVFEQYRGNLNGISEGLYRISDPAELVSIVANRLKAVHGDFINKAPTGISLANTETILPENSSTAVRRKLADIVIADDGYGTNSIVLSGRDAASFEVEGFALFLKSGVILDFESQHAFSVTIGVNDTSNPGSLSASTPFTFFVGNLKEAPTITVPLAGFHLTEDTTGRLVFQSTPFGTTDSPASKWVTVILTTSRGVLWAQSTEGVSVKKVHKGTSFTGRLDDLNHFFTNPAGHIRYRPAANDNAPVSFGITVVERAIKGPLRSSATTTIAIKPVNDSPILRAPARFSAFEGRSSQLSWSTIASPFGDVDSSILTVTLAVDHGRIDATGRNGVKVGGTETARTFTGTKSNLNSYFRSLGRITYTPGNDKKIFATLRTTLSDSDRSTKKTSLIRIHSVK